MNISVLTQTPNPAEICAMAISQTMVAEPTGNNIKAIEFCYKAKHRSVFEHVHLGVRITGASRALMAQLTRHRHVAFTCSSQHYQEYSDYPIVDCGYSGKDDDRLVYKACKQSVEAYNSLLAYGLPKEEARMVLPEAMGVNLIMTANARTWAHIMNLRTCERNVPEMHDFALSMYTDVLYPWFPELFKHVGPDCVEGKCVQGRMACSKK